MPDNLEFTGERFTPECLREIRYEHFHRYALAASWVKDRKVLDAACGEGYGSFLLSRAAREVTGVDISGQAITHAKSRYPSNKLDFVESDCCELPFADHSFECVVSFETLEHLENQQALLAEFRRVLKPTGFLLISSPDKAIYSDKLGNENPFHVNELYRSELDELLSQYFPVITLLGQKLGFHSMIWPLQPSSDAQYLLQQDGPSGVQSLQRPSGDAVYLLALCAASSDNLPDLEQSLYLFDDDSESVYEHYYHEIRQNLESGRILQDMEQRLEQLEQELQAVRSDSNLRPDVISPSKSWWSTMLRKLGGSGR